MKNLWRAFVRAGVVAEPEARKRFRTLYASVDQAFANAVGSLSAQTLGAVADDLERAEVLCNQLWSLLLPAELHSDPFSKDRKYRLPAKDLARVIAVQDFLGEPIETSRFLALLRKVRDEQQRRSTASWVRSGALTPVSLNSRKSHGDAALRIEFIRELCARTREYFDTSLYNVVAEAANAMTPGLKLYSSEDVRKLDSRPHPRKIRDKK